MIEVNRLQYIKDKIEKMNKQQQVEVLKLLLDSKIEVSENNNGTFINLTEIEEKIIVNLEEYIIFISQQNKLIEDVEEKKQQIQDLFFDSKTVIKTNHEYNLE